MNDEIKIGLDISESEYRDLPYPSYSLLSDIAKVGGANIGSIKREEIQELDGIMVGKLVDNLLIENKLPDNFYTVKKKPVAKAKDLIVLLAKNRDKLPNQELCHPDNEDLIHKCCEAISYNKGKKQKQIDGLKNYVDYYNILTKASDNSFIISEYLYYQAKKCVKILKEQYAQYFIKNNDVIIVPQVKLVGEVNGVKIKGMLDFIVIVDSLKLIIPIDLKTGAYSAEDFMKKGYLGWNYYIQSALYKELLIQEMNSHSIYKDYEIASFRFVFISRLDNSDTEMQVTNMLHIEAMEGFKTFDGKIYPGVNELINEYNRYK